MQDVHRYLNMISLDAPEMPANLVEECFVAGAGPRTHEAKTI